MSAARATGAATQVDQALRTVGFVQVTGHGIPALAADGLTQAVIECLPGCATAEPPAQYDPISVAEHLTAKLTGSWALAPNAGPAREAARLRGPFARSAAPRGVGC